MHAAGDDAEPDAGGYVDGRVFLVTTVFLAALVLLAGVAGYLVPASEFVPTPDGPPAIRAAESAPVAWWGILLSPLLVLGGPNGARLIVLSLFILFIGGSFSILDRGGILPTLLERMATRFADRRRTFLVLNAIVFAVVGSTLGILEELVPLILLYVPLARRFGWDDTVGMAIPFLSSGFGFAAATFNPFTVGTAQQLAGLPLFSGVGLRLGFLVVTTTLVIGFLLWRTRGAVDGPVEHIEPGPAPPWMGRVVWWMGGCMALVAVVVGAGTQVQVLQDLAFPLIALIFLAMGIGGGLLAGLGGRRVGRLFGRGLIDFAPAIGLILLAASVGFLLTEARVMPTLLGALADQIREWSAGGAAVAIYVGQMLINFAVPSGTGQAALTIPLLAPLGDLIGVSRQTVVLAFQCGDGFSNMLWPTNPVLLVALGLAGISWRDWFRWVLPLQLALAAVSVALLLLAVSIGYS